MTLEEMEQVLPGIYRIPVPLTGNPLRELNSYVVTANHKGGKNLLIDTGFRRPECKQAILEGLKLLGISMEHTDILLTHLHADHSGNAPELICGENRIWMSAVDREFLLGSRKEDGNHYQHRAQAELLRRHGIPEELIGEMLGCAPSKTMAANLTQQKEQAYMPLQDGETILAGDYTLRAILTPGHTPGQMCFEVLGTGAMLLGDHVLFDITPNIANWIGVKDSLGDYLSSLDKIDCCNVTIPLPGHRKPGDFHQRVAQLKAHHAARLEECRKIVAELGRAELYQIAGNMTWRIRAASWDTFPAAQRWFALGECIAHLDHLVLEGRLERLEDEKGMWIYRS